MSYSDSDFESDIVVRNSTTSSKYEIVSNKVTVEYNLDSEFPGCIFGEFVEVDGARNVILKRHNNLYFVINLYGEISLYGDISNMYNFGSSNKYKVMNLGKIE